MLCFSKVSDMATSASAVKNLHLKCHVKFTSKTQRIEKKNCQDTNRVRLSGDALAFIVSILVSNNLFLLKLYNGTKIQLNSTLIYIWTWIYAHMHVCSVWWTTQYTIENKNLLGVIENIIYTYNYNYCHTFHYQGERRICGNH